MQNLNSKDYKIIVILEKWRKWLCCNHYFRSIFKSLWIINWLFEYETCSNKHVLLNNTLLYWKYKWQFFRLENKIPISFKFSIDLIDLFYELRSFIHTQSTQMWAAFDRLSGLLERALTHTQPKGKTNPWIVKLSITALALPSTHSISSQIRLNFWILNFL